MKAKNMIKQEDLHKKMHEQDEALALVSCELGYIACEKGLSLLQAQAEILKSMKPVIRCAVVLVLLVLSIPSIVKAQAGTRVAGNSAAGGQTLNNAGTQFPTTQSHSHGATTSSASGGPVVQGGPGEIVTWEEAYKRAEEAGKCSSTGCTPNLAEAARQAAEQKKRDQASAPCTVKLIAVQGDDGTLHYVRQPCPKPQAQPKTK